MSVVVGGAGALPTGMPTTVVVLLPLPGPVAMPLMLLLFPMVRPLTAMLLPVMLPLPALLMPDDETVRSRDVVKLVGTEAIGDGCGC